MAEYSAELWWACVLVVALVTAAAPTSPVARQIRVADCRARSIYSSIRPVREAAASSQFMHEKWRDLDQRWREQAEDAGVTVINDFDKPFEAAMATIYEKAQCDPATAALIDRIRKTE